MSYAVNFRKRSGLDLFGKPIYAQSSFWSKTPFPKGKTAFVFNDQFFTPMKVEVNQSTPTGKTVNDFNFFLKVS